MENSVNQIRHREAGGSSAHGRMRWAFAVVLATGTSGILLGTTLELRLLVVGLPLLALLAYLAFAWLSDRTALASTQFADSVYFLGFLFTLIALVVSLVEFGEDDVASIVPLFAVALTTTVVGLTIRILLVNFRRTAGESLQEAQAALEEATGHFRHQLNRFSVDLVAQLASHGKALDESLNATRSGLATMLDDSTEAVHASATSLAATGKEASAQLQALLEGSLQDLTDTLTVNRKGIAGALDDLRGSIESADLKGPLSVLSTAVEESAEKLRRGATTYVDLGKGLEAALTDLATRIGRAGEESARALSESMAELARELRATFDTLTAKIRATPPVSTLLRESLKDPLTRASTGLREYGAALGSLTQQQQQLGTALEEQAAHLAKLTGAAQRLKATMDAVELDAANVRELDQQLKALSEGIMAAEGAYAANVNVLGKHSAAITAALEGELKTAENHRHRMDDHLAEASRAVGRVHAELTEAARFIRRELSE